MATGLRFGAGAVLYYNSASYGTPTWVPITNVGDLELDIDFEEAEAATRASGMATEPTLQHFEIGFEMLEDMSDTVFVALKGFFLAKTSEDYFVCSGAYNASGENYARSDCKIVSFKKTEPLKGVNKYAVKIKRAYNTTHAITAGVTT